MAGNGSGWRLPVDQAHRVVDDAGPLCFVGGAGDFGADGRIAHPGDFDAQVQGAPAKVAVARKMAVIRHRMGMEEAGFRWSNKEVAV